MMTHRERFLAAMYYRHADRRPVYLAKPWPDTLARWRKEGLPADVTDIHAFLGVDGLGYKVANITPIAGLHPPFQEEVISDDGEFVLQKDRCGRTAFSRFIAPRYAKAMAFARDHGIGLTLHDSDGDCRMLLPLMLEAGVNSTAPCEVAAGMDPVALRAQFGRELRICGGFDKRIVPCGSAAVRTELERLAPVIREGGFAPGIDHSVSSDISWDHYRRFLDLIIQGTVL
jgi:hypothetical protein